jgi:2-oxoglutarate dehydrogenase complex dehydrogenase (E1) component-like enzyme
LHFSEDLTKVSEKITNISAFIAENFGANASYVEGLLARFQSNPNSVDESWQKYFGEMLEGNGSVGVATQAEVSKPQTETQAPPPKAEIQTAPNAPAAAEKKSTPVVQKDRREHGTKSHGSDRDELPQHPCKAS